MYVDTLHKMYKLQMAYPNCMKELLSEKLGYIFKLSP